MLLNDRESRCMGFQDPRFVPSDVLDGRAQLLYVIHPNRRDPGHHRLCNYICRVILPAIVSLKNGGIDPFFDVCMDGSQKQ